MTFDSRLYTNLLLLKTPFSCWTKFTCILSLSLLIGASSKAQEFKTVCHEVINHRNECWRRISNFHIFFFLFCNIFTMEIKLKNPVSGLKRKTFRVVVIWKVKKNKSLNNKNEKNKKTNSAPAMISKVLLNNSFMNIKWKKRVKKKYPTTTNAVWPHSRRASLLNSSYHHLLALDKKKWKRNFVWNIIWLAINKFSLSLFFCCVFVSRFSQVLTTSQVTRWRIGWTKKIDGLENSLARDVIYIVSILHYSSSN